MQMTEQQAKKRLSDVKREVARHHPHLVTTPMRARLLKMVQNGFDTCEMIANAIGKDRKIINGHLTALVNEGLLIHELGVSGYSYSISYPVFDWGACHEKTDA